jgi:hypothetical protein
MRQFGLGLPFIRLDSYGNNISIPMFSHCMVAGAALGISYRDGLASDRRDWVECD